MKHIRITLILGVYETLILQGVFSSLVPPLKVLNTKKLIWARLGVSRSLYANVDSPNLGFSYFLGEAQCKKHPVFEGDKMNTSQATHLGKRDELNSSK